MELFTINRYTDTIKDSGETNEEAILQKLLKKAEKRKLKKNAADTPSKKLSTSQQETNETTNEPPKVINDTKNVDDVSDFLSGDKEEQNDQQNESIIAETEFQVLGDNDELKKRQRVEMILPPWLAHPTVIATSIPQVDDEKHKDDIKNLNFLRKPIRQSLKDMNITRLFPVQKAVIPWILEAHLKPKPYRPRDICVSAPTGSGKTLAFAIPVVQLLESRVECKIYALVVLPVAELAVQVYKVFKSLCNRTSLKVCLLNKKTPFEAEQKKLVSGSNGRYYSNVDIVVTTPGRLVEHMHATPGFCLESLMFLIIDEADRIMDAVFQNWLYHFDTRVRNTTNQLLSGSVAPLCLMELEKSYKQPHKLLFSATLSQDPEKLQHFRLFHPKLFTSILTDVNELSAIWSNEKENKQKENIVGQFIGKFTTPAELTEKYCITEANIKPLTLFSLIKENEWQKFLCFTNSAESSTRLTIVLKELFKITEIPISVEELSSNLSSDTRSKTLKEFSIGSINGIISSDALARGIDVPNIDVVISYDSPRHIKTYIHRIGRTARAGRPGTSITMLTQKELEPFQKKLNEAGKVITEEIHVSPTAEMDHASTYATALQRLRYQLQFKKNKKLVDKKRSQVKSTVHKDPEQLTLMEKLQMGADEGNLSKSEPQQKTSKKIRLKKTPKQKFNPSAGKNKKILK